MTVDVLSRPPVPVAVTVEPERLQVRSDSFRADTRTWRTSVAGWLCMVVAEPVVVFAVGPWAAIGVGLAYLACALPWDRYISREFRPASGGWGVRRR